MVFYSHFISDIICSQIALTALSAIVSICLTPPPPLSANVSICLTPPPPLVSHWQHFSNSGL